MKSVKTLGAITIGAILLSATYAVALKDRNVKMVVDSDSGRSMHHNIRGDRGDFVLRDDDGVLEASWRGDFEFTEDGADIASIERSLKITYENDDVEQRAEFERDGDGVEKTYYVDDEKQPANEETDQAIAELFLHFLRVSGVQSDERVAILLEQGGAEAILTELDALEGDHAMRRYSVALTEQTDLTNDQIKELAIKLKAIDSDHDLRLSLRSLLENETISEETTPALLDAASTVESDHDLRLLVESFAERPLNDEAMELALGLYERIDSDHDLRVSAEALLENSALTNAQAARLLTTAAREIESDHDMRLVLTETASMFSTEQSLTDAWMDGFASLESSHDQRLSIIAAVDEGGHPASALETLIKATETFHSDHDQRLALQALADEIDADAALLNVYRAAAATIDSDHDRRLALEAIGDESED